MSRFIDDRPQRLSISPTEWIEVKNLSYEHVQELLEKLSDKEKKTERALEQIKFLKAMVVGWNFTKDDGAAVPYTEDMIDKLDFRTIVAMTKATNNFLFPSKKKQTPSGEQPSEEEAQEDVEQK